MSNGSSPVTGNFKVGILKVEHFGGQNIRNGMDLGEIANLLRDGTVRIRKGRAGRYLHTLRKTKALTKQRRTL